MSVRDEKGRGRPCAEAADEQRGDPHAYPIEIEGIRFTQACYPFREGLKILGLAASTAYLLMKRGELDTFMFAGRRQISSAEIVRRMRMNQAVPAASSDDHTSAIGTPEYDKLAGEAPGRHEHPAKDMDKSRTTSTD